MRQPIAIVFGVLLGVACGSQETQFSLPDASTGPDVSGPDIALGIDIGGSSPTPDGGELSDGGSSNGDGGSTAGLSDSEDDSSAPADAAVDAGPQPITSCAGRCGLLLTDQGNPCSCFPSCKTAGNCCADFELSCTCGSDAACDDLDPCTQDSCKNGWCLNYPIPQKTCCKTDSECKGGDLCNVAKCLDGQCGLQPTDCNDGLDCTQDVCNPADGQCVNKMLTGKCLIDGKCQKAGDVDPESAGCAICDPVKSTTAWSAKIGKCAIAGGCYNSGDVNPMAACAICDSAKNPGGWSAKTGQCFIDGQCLAKNAANPADPGCQVCDPSTPTQWSPVAGKCLIDGQCLADGTPDPSAPDCRKCDVAKSKIGWTAIAGACLVDGVCAKAGGSQPGSGGCAVCDPGKSTTAWTLVANGGKCDDGSVCTTGEVCDGKGTCKGAAKTGCCMADADCATFKFPSGQEPGPCDEVYCQKSAGTCAKKVIAKCCIAGVCCDVPAKTVKPANTPCSTFVKNVEYQCDGQDVQKRTIFYGCTGSDAAKCSSDVPGYGDWGTVKTCGAEEVCTPGADKGVVPTCKSK